MDNIQQEIDARTNLTHSNQFELLLFRLGSSVNSDQSELFGINVFKIKEIVVSMPITAIAGAPEHILGVVNLRGQIIPVIDLPAVVGCTPATGLNIMLVTEFARNTQAFAVESVEDIVRLDWNQVQSAEYCSDGMVTSIAQLEKDGEHTAMVLVLDVETIMRQIKPEQASAASSTDTSVKVVLPQDTLVLAADDSLAARNMIERGLASMDIKYVMTKTGKEAWDQLQSIAEAAKAEGKRASDKVALVLTDLEMPEMDGFTLTRNIKQDARFNDIPVIIHSSLTGAANEEHVKKVGADGYVAKFVAQELAAAIRQVLGKR